MPISGQVVTRAHLGKNVTGSYVLRAFYTDRGANNLRQTTRQQTITLRSPRVLAADADVFADAAKGNNGDSKMVKFTKDSAYIVFHQIDLTDIKHLTLSIKPKKTSGKIVLHVGSREGKVIGSTPELSQASFGASANQWNKVTLPVEVSTGQQDLYFVFTGSAETSIWDTFDLNTIYFDNK